MLKTLKKRETKVVSFNPPYSQNVKTNIGKLFFKLVREHFPDFNFNTSKLSYCCTTSVRNIEQHNSKVLGKTNDYNNQM